MRKMKLNFKRNINQMFVISIIAPVLVFSSFLSWYYSKKSIASHQQNISNVLYASSKSLEILFYELEQISFTPYLHKDILSAMKLMKNGYLEKGKDVPSFLDAKRLEDNYSMVFTKLLHTSIQQILEITFYPNQDNTQNAYLINKNSSGIQSVHAPALNSESWYHSTKEKNGFLFYAVNQEVLLGSKVNNYISATRVIKDLDSKKNIGLLKIDFSSSAIESILDTVEPPPHSYLVLVDDSNQLVYSSNNISDSLLNQACTTINPSIKQGSEVFYLSTQPIGRTNLKLLYLSSRSDVVISNTSNFFLILGITIFGLLSAYLIYVKQTSRMISSVNEIIKTIRKLEKGDLTAECQVNDKNEFKLIAKSLNEMSKKLSHHIEKEYEAIRNQRNAEYLALQSQINPHFFYNILNGFIGLNRMGEKELLEKSIIQLTHMFRYTCRNSNLSTVGEEFDFVSRYLELKKLRYEDRFNYTIEYSKETQSFVIPKLIIQPLVENSILHGINPDGSTINITASAEIIKTEKLERLEIKISDDGVGFEESSLENDTAHVGLKNIIERLKYFNPQSQFTIESKPDYGTICIITIPISSDTANIKYIKPEESHADFAR